jgi:hypothetical protein
VPLVEKATEVFIIKEGGGLAFGINIHRETGEVPLSSKRLLFIDSLVGMPTAKVTKNLVQEATKIVSFP